MKFWLIIFLLSFNSSLMSQGLLKELDSQNFGEKLYALRLIQQYNLKEYIPHLEKRIFNQDEFFITYFMLRALDQLDSPNLQSIAVEYISRIEDFDSSEVRGGLKTEA